MLFRTKLVAAISALGAVAIICAGLLILSSQRSAENQKHTTLAYESLSGYLQLSGSVFRTFKQARRDLVSGSGRFAFDLKEAQTNIKKTLTEIEKISGAEAKISTAWPDYDGLAQVENLSDEIAAAFEEISQASEMILAGQRELGQALAIQTLEGRVDARIAILIEEAITAERGELTKVQDDILFFNRIERTVAWASVCVALLLFSLVLFTLVRRLNTSLGALEQGAKEYAQDNLSHEIALSGNDELSAVANRFSGMAQQIESKQEALEAARQSLERRVDERTFELSKANSELQERDQMRSQFFADIGHELRTPVTAIRGQAEVALRDKSEPQVSQRAALETIVTLCEQLTESVGDLFLIARGQAGVLDFRNQPVDLSEAASQAVAQMQSLVTNSGAKVIHDFGQDEFVIEGDLNRLTQFIRILISNSLTHSPRGVQIKISAHRLRNSVHLTVSDNGPGIAAPDRSRIFDRYVKVPKDGNHSASGTGLGLAIAKSITQAHGGKISLEENACGGTHITAKFPATDQRAL